MGKERIQYLDFIRGLMILWVLVTHISMNYGIIHFGEPIQCRYSPFLWFSFYMIPFYVFSGYFFNNKRPFIDFLLNKAKRLLIPYVTFSVFGFFLYFCFKSVTGHFSLDFFRTFPETFCLRSNTPCWFFISLFSCNILYYVVSLRGELIKHFIIFIFFLLALYNHNKTQILGCGNVFLGIVYIHIGYILHKYQEKLDNIYVFFIAIFMYVFIGFFCPQRLSFVLNFLVQGSYILNLIFSVAACFMLWYSTKRMLLDSIVAKFVIFLGANSLVLFATHRAVLNWIYEPIIKKCIPNCSYFLFLILGLIVLIAFFMFFDFFMKKKFPKLLGL